MLTSSVISFLIVLLIGNGITLLLIKLKGTFSSKAPPPRPCQNQHDNYDFCNTLLPIESRVSSLLLLLTPSEKISLLGNNAAAVPRLGLPPYQWWNEGLHGVASSGCCPPERVRSTSFPQVCSLGVSFNTTLFAAIGDAIGAEADQHFWKTGDMPGLTYWAPNVNIFRDPRWGRGQEVPGEDPFLNGIYASYLIPAMQYTKEGRRLRVAAACKHFYAYNLETNRLSFNAVVDKRDLQDSFLPAFEKCVESGALGIMCSYNAVNGVPACAHSNMLIDKLRLDWKFKGYVTGDCGAVENIYSTHHYAATKEEAVRIALEAGVDVDCGNWIQKYGVKALKNASLAIEHVDRALGNLLRIQFRLGYYDPRPKHAPFVSVQLHNDLSLDASRQAIVLLKNELMADNAARLPLDQKRHKAVALFGPNADAPATMQGNYEGIAPFLVSPKQGLEDLGIDVVYEKGCNISSPLLETKTDRMCQAAARADAVVLVVGLDQSLESEGCDRTSLRLPPVQDKLITDISSCSRQPVILIVMAGGPVDLTPYKDNDSVAAMLYVGYPGQSGGTAIADALYGEFSPSGRLTTTVYSESYAEKVALADMRMRQDSADGFPGRTYRFYYGYDVVYPFGYGLSYTQFDYEISVQDTTVIVQVRNNGPMDASDSVLLFHEDPNAGTEGNPNKSLVAFDKIHVKAGEEGSVKFVVDSHVKGSLGFHRFCAGPTRDYCVHVAGRAFELKDTK